MRELLVIGGGPAGVQAAVSAATEGIETYLAEPGKIGGQIAQTPHLENMAGYPYGVTGASFAQAMEDQLFRVGVKVIRERVWDIEPSRAGAGAYGSGFNVQLGDEVYRFLAVIVATGKRFKEIPVDDSHPEVLYGPDEVFQFDASGREVVVVGGGNSAGQAIVHLSARADRVHVIAPKLLTSQYLTDRIMAAPTVNLNLGARLVEVDRRGPDDLLVTSRNHDALARTVEACRVFICAGVEPNTRFLDRDLVVTDDDGLLVTDEDFAIAPWAPGLFAIGDVRSGAVNRVPSAIGEGSNVQPALWRYLRG